MAKKRKEVRKIVIDTELSELDNKPSCFGEKSPYCMPLICGEWYSRCTSSEGNLRCGKCESVED